jgi:Zn-dependent alcohol dehydrogenase
MGSSTDCKNSPNLRRDDRGESVPEVITMLTTDAGTVKAARIVILGVGVAGLHAIATAKCLGAVIEASDVRPSVKEQEESLGAKFIDVPYEPQEERDAAEGIGGLCATPPLTIWLAQVRFRRKRLNIPLRRPGQRGIIDYQ